MLEQVPQDVVCILFLVIVILFFYLIDNGGNDINIE